MPMEPNTLFQQCRAGSLVLGQLVNVVASEKKKWTFLGQTACHLTSCVLGRILGLLLVLKNKLLTPPAALF
jgi:hypothetical protein